MTGRADIALPLTPAKAGAALAANDQRQDYVRASLERDTGGQLVATAFKTPDSSMMSLLAQSGALIVRRPHAPPVQAGEAVEILRLDESTLVTDPSPFPVARESLYRFKTMAMVAK